MKTFVLATATEAIETVKASIKLAKKMFEISVYDGTADTNQNEILIDIIKNGDAYIKALNSLEKAIDNYIANFKIDANSTVDMLNDYIKLNKTEFDITSRNTVPYDVFCERIMKRPLYVARDIIKITHALRVWASRNGCKEGFGFEFGDTDFTTEKIRDAELFIRYFYRMREIFNNSNSK